MRTNSLFTPLRLMSTAIIALIEAAGVFDDGSARPLARISSVSFS